MRGRAGASAVAENEDRPSRLPRLINQFRQAADFGRVDPFQLRVQPIQICVDVDRDADHAVFTLVIPGPSSPRHADGQPGLLIVSAGWRRTAEPFSSKEYPCRALRPIAVGFSRTGENVPSGVAPRATIWLAVSPNARSARSWWAAPTLGVWALAIDGREIGGYIQRVERRWV